MISIVIPLYNKAAVIGRTLDTVFAQTYQDFEVVVVDDGSTDGSAAVVEAVGDPRIRLVRQENAGVSAARNRGIAEAKGEYIAFLDADDEWMPEYLETQHRLTVKYKDCDVFATDYLFKKPAQQSSGTILRDMGISKGADGLLDNYFVVAANSHPPLWTSAVMVRKGAIESVGGFPMGIKSGEDLLAWARLACRYKIAYSRTPLAIFNIEGYSNREKPKRIPAEPDVVGAELGRLLMEYNPHGMRAYIAMWHKMRANIYLRLGMRRRSVREVCRGLRMQPTNYKLMLYLVLNALPSQFRG